MRARNFRASSFVIQITSFGESFLAQIVKATPSLGAGAMVIFLPFSCDKGMGALFMAAYLRRSLER